MGSLNSNAEERFFMLLWGPPKTGKTVLASQFPKPYFICLERGLGSVRAMSKKEGASIDFPVIEIDGKDSTDEDFIKLCGPMKGLTAWEKTFKLFQKLCETLPKGTTLIVDNTSRLNEYLMVWLKKKVGRETLQLQDWGVYVAEWTKFLEFATTSRCDIIFIAHEDIKEDKVTEELMKVVLMPTNMKYRIPSVVTDFVYLSSVVSGPVAAPKVVRRLQCTPNKYMQIGNRSLIPNIDNPTYAKLRPYLTAALGRDPGNPTWTPSEPTTAKS